MRLIQMKVLIKFKIISLKIKNQILVVQTKRILDLISKQIQVKNITKIMIFYNNKKNFKDQQYQKNLLNFLQAKMIQINKNIAFKHPNHKLIIIEIFLKVVNKLIPMEV